jgi:hypothetical protein
VICVPSFAGRLVALLLALLHAPFAAISSTPVIFTTTSTVRSYTAGSGCSGQSATQYYAINTNACTSEQGRNKEQHDNNIT